MPAESANTGGVALIIQSGDFERVHYGLALAAAAVAVNRPALLFFTNGAINALANETDGYAAWQDLPADAGAWGARAAGAQHSETGAERDAVLKVRGVGDFETLLQSCAQLGARFIVCEMGLRAIGLAEAALRQDIPITLAGIVTFYEEAGSSQIMVL